MSGSTKKRILILGAGVYQVPLIRKARDMGLETVVVSYRGDYPGIPLADIFVDVDTTDVDGVAEAARRAGVSAVATTGTDVCVPAMGRVVDVLGLPGTGYEAACRSMDKILMKQAFLSHHVPTAAFEYFTSPGKAKDYAAHIGYPVMVKATDLSGSRGVTKVASAEEFDSAWKRAEAASHAKQIIVERFLEGFEFGAQAFIHEDEVMAVFPHGDTVTPAPYFTPIGHSMPSALTDAQQKKCAEVIGRAARALGLRDCISNVDLMLVDDEPVIIEMGARMGATCLPECLAIYTGMDIYQHLIQLALGEHPAIAVSAAQANACLLLRSHQTGILASLHVPEDVARHPDLIELHWDIEPGEQVRAFVVGPDRIGHIIVKAAASRDAERLVERLASKISLEIIRGTE